MYPSAKIDWELYIMFKVLWKIVQHILYKYFKWVCICNEYY